MWLKKTYMTYIPYMFKIITEVVCVSPEASGDKNENKIVEVDYEIPPKSQWQTKRTTFVNYFERSVFTHNPT